jgi:hypothetical protein
LFKRPQEVTNIMPKPKHVEQVPSLDEFRAPWETESGTDAEIDKTRLRKYIHSLLTDKARAQEALEAKETAETEKAAAEKRAEDATGGETQKALNEALAKAQKFEDEVKTLKAEKAKADLRAEVLGDLDPKYAKYVTGETKADLEKSLEQVREDFGLPKPGEQSEDDDEDDEDDEDDDGLLRRQPRRLSNGRVDFVGGDDDNDIDPEKVAERLVGGSSFY